MVAVADLNGDGIDDLVRVRDEVALWWDQRAELGGEPQVVGRGDIDGDGHEEALIATGMGRGDTEAPARLWAIGAKAARMLWEQRTARSQVTDLHVLPDPAGGPDRIWLVSFKDARVAQGGFLVDGTVQVVQEAALALRMMPVADGTLVGRMYGDAPRSDGDLRRVGPQGERVIPTLRGVRSLISADLDGDGKPEWLVGDGWHFAYGQQGDATLRVIPGDDRPARVITRLDGNYIIRDLAVARAPGSGAPLILATGSTEAVLLQQDGLGWAPTSVTHLAETDNAVLSHDKDGLSVVVSGMQARRFPLVPATAPATSGPATSGPATSVPSTPARP